MYFADASWRVARCESQQPQKHGMMVTASVAVAAAVAASQHLYNLHNGKENACCADTDTTVADTCSTLSVMYERDGTGG